MEAHLETAATVFEGDRFPAVTLCLQSKTSSKSGSKRKGKLSMVTVYDPIFSQQYSTHLAFLVKALPLKHCEREGRSKEPTVAEMGFWDLRGA
jgi:hypothetical protein